MGMKMCICERGETRGTAEEWQAPVVKDTFNSNKDVTTANRVACMKTTP